MNVFAKNMIDIYGNRGEKWLAELPAITATIAEKYALTDLVPVSNMNFNYVLAGYQNDKPIILKVGLNYKELAKEALCLKAFARHGGVEVLAASNEGMLIIERAIPGSTLKEYFPSRDDEAVIILCSVIEKLRYAEIPEYHNFYKLNDLLKTLDDGLDIPKEILSKARRLRDELLATSDKTVLLHGDLHHENILQNGDDWLVIDPKGLIGDPIYEVCAFINNPIPELLESHNPIKIINNRILLCADLLGFPEQRIRNWHYVQTVLCWAWQLEDNVNSQYFIKLLNMIC